MIFKDIFPRLSRSQIFHEKVQDFPGGMGTLRTTAGARKNLQ